MTAEYRVSEMLEAMRDAGLLPSADGSFSSANLVSVMNMEQRLYLARLLLSAREEYQVAHADVALVSGQTRYAIPSRAIGAKLKRVALVDSAGGETVLNPATSDRAQEFGAPGAGYYLERNSLVLLGTATGTLRLTYFRRLNRLVEAEEAGVVTEIDTATKQVTLSATPDGWDTSDTFDFVQANPHFDTLGADAAVTGLASNVLTFEEELPDELAVGDYVCLSGETPVCQAPLELHNVLVQRALVKVLTAKRDPGAADAKVLLDEMRDDALSLISPRVEGTPLVIVNPHAPGWGRSRTAFRRWR